MYLAMVSSAEGYRKLVTDLPAECRQLGKSQMMRIGGMPAADQTGLLANRFHVLAVANPPGHRQR
jgi:hypothetical protein